MALTKEKNLQIYSLNGSGCVIEVIAKKAGVTKEEVKESLNNRNRAYVEWEAMNEEERRVFVNQLVYDRHKTVEVVSDITGLSEKAIYKYLKNKESSKKITPSIADKIIELRQLGKTHREIADELGVGTATVNRYLHKNTQNTQTSKPSQINEDFDKAVNEMIAETKKEPAPAATDTDSTSENINSLYPNDIIDEPKSQEPEPEMCPEWLLATTEDMLFIYNSMTEAEQRAWDLGQIYGRIAHERARYV